MVDGSTNTSQEYAKKIHLIMDDEDDFHEFTGIVRKFKSNEILESTAIIKLTGMIKHKCEDLTLGLNHCLSEGFQIEKSGDGQLFYRSPAQEDLIPLVADVRMQQVMGELNEAKFRILQAKGEQEAAANTISEQSITIDDLKSALKDEKQKNKDALKKLQEDSHTISQQSIAIDNLKTELKDERQKNKNNLKKLQQESRLALKKEKRQCNDKVRKIQREAQLEQEAEVQNIKNDFDRFREKSQHKKKQLKLLIRQLQVDNKEDMSLKGTVQALETHNKILRGQIKKHWESASDQLNSNYEQLKIEYEILTESQQHLQLSNDELKLALEHAAANNRLISKIRKRVQSTISNMECPICFDLMENTHISPECLHRLCGECFKTSLLKCNHECPQCRVHLSSKRSLRKDYGYDTLANALYDIKNIALGGHEGNTKSGNDCDSRMLSGSESEEETIADTTSKAKTSEHPLDPDQGSESTDDENNLPIADAKAKASEKPLDPDQGDESADDENNLDEGSRASAGLNQRNLKKRCLMTFNERLEQLKKFKATHGHLNVTKTVDLSLTRWCTRARKSYQFRKNAIIVQRWKLMKITDEQIASLEELGFELNPSSSSSRHYVKRQRYS